MPDTFISKMKKRLWNAFARDPTPSNVSEGNSYYYRPDRPRFSRGNERSTLTAIYNKIAMDVAAIDIKHVRLDEDGRFLEEIDSEFNECLNVSANLDQTSRAFKQDIVISMIDEGCVAVVPTETTDDPRFSDEYDIMSMRVGKILQWYPTKVKVRLYNENTGRKEDLIFDKKHCAIIENPLFSVMNEPNSTLQRLTRKLNLLDYVDEQSSSGKLDLIIQLPYTIKSELRKTDASKRLDNIREQLKGPYGIAYIDGTEKITQLNRPIENNLLKQIEYLTNQVFSQIGINQEIMNGTADERTMLNYNNGTVEPFISAIVDEYKRKFLSKTARKEDKQSIEFFRDPFRLVPVTDMAEVGDKFTRNEILSKNEIRQGIGFRPSKDPKADMLINSNISQSKEVISQQNNNSLAQTNKKDKEEIQNEM